MLRASPSECSDLRSPKSSEEQAAGEAQPTDQPSRGAWAEDLGAPDVLELVPKILGPPLRDLDHGVCVRQGHQVDQATQRHEGRSWWRAG